MFSEEVILVILYLAHWLAKKIQNHNVLFSVIFFKYYKNVSFSQHEYKKLNYKYDCKLWE